MWETCYKIGQKFGLRFGIEAIHTLAQLILTILDRESILLIKYLDKKGFNKTSNLRLGRNKPIQIFLTVRVHRIHSKKLNPISELG